MNDELQRIVDSLNAWGWSANARISFNKLILHFSPPLRVFITLNTSSPVNKNEAR